MISDINHMVLSPYSMVEATRCFNPCTARDCSGSLADNRMFFTFWNAKDSQEMVLPSF